MESQMLIKKVKAMAAKYLKALQSHPDYRVQSGIEIFFKNLRQLSEKVAFLEKIEPVLPVIQIAAIEQFCWVDCQDDNFKKGLLFDCFYDEPTTYEILDFAYEKLNRNLISLYIEEMSPMQKAKYIQFITTNFPGVGMAHIEHDYLGRF